MNIGLEKAMEYSDYRRGIINLFTALLLGKRHHW